MEGFGVNLILIRWAWKRIPHLRERQNLMPRRLVLDQPDASWRCVLRGLHYKDTITCVGYPAALSR
jgi:hypothetical protein